MNSNLDCLADNGHFSYFGAFAAFQRNLNCSLKNATGVFNFHTSHRVVVVAERNDPGPVQLVLDNAVLSRLHEAWSNSMLIANHPDNQLH